MGMTSDEAALRMLDEAGLAQCERFYSEDDADLRVSSLVVHPDAGTVDCPVCEAPVPAEPSSVERRYGPAPDYLTGQYRWTPSPKLCTLSCGHRIELVGA